MALRLTDALWGGDLSLAGQSRRSEDTREGRPRKEGLGRGQQRELWTD